MACLIMRGLNSISKKVNKKLNNERKVLQLKLRKCDNEFFASCFPCCTQNRVLSPACHPPNHNKNDLLFYEPILLIMILPFIIVL